ncbi:site-specific DNA-methyltransferase [Curtobacterium sp. MCBD17_040]|uniref:DNA-methyltransferase n=1 Tax=Curtobacterium sp. MCBD17_040 TaxID=2175674 RepID=UPI001C65214C|nr:site-specific DNA-methyltransferase [Curtobacterium sp. MCBD17_040]WIB64039.1 site-specific DNA-methyltransferase [Curtobacterium sp. MCBD17_040]
MTLTAENFVVPPHSQSMRDGRLKLTPANRALSPEATPQELFTSDAVRENAPFADDRSVLLLGDVKERLRQLINSGIKVDAIVTSPPYYGQRDYGVDGQLGLEAHPREFIAHLVEVFDLCFQLLKDTGSLWVNIGDTYWSGKGAHKSVEAKQGARRFGVRPQDRPGDGGWARPKQQLLIPHRLAIALQDEGWLVRNDNVWIKPNPVPDQVRDRSSASHEYVFHFTKSRWYYYDRHPVGRTMPSGSILPPLSTWSAAKSAGGTKHRASFSEELVRIPVLATVPNDGVVLDPFNGSGTTMTFARKHGRRAIGIDLSEEYCQIAEDRLRAIADGDMTV